jgi:hypothetical protein
MTLAELAHLVDVDAKWVLNALAALGRPARYSIVLARRLAVTTAIQRATGASLAFSFAQAEQAMRLYQSDHEPIVVQAEDADVAMLVDVHRILSSFNVRLSLLRTSVEPRQRGRPRARRGDALRAAEEWGIDLRLLADNVGKTVEQRVRQLDAMAAFASTVRRAPTVAG